MDHCCPLQHAFSFGDHLLLLERLVYEKIKYLLCFKSFGLNMLRLFFFFVAGWIGNDAVTPIIGEHDPYFHVYGRVSFNIPIQVH